MKGAAFDIPQDEVERVWDLYEQAVTHGSAKGYTLEVAWELPELMDSDTRQDTWGGQGGYGQR